jgi:hypothetical protein
MGLAEEVMRSWGYGAAGICIVLGLTSLVLAVMLFVIVKSEASETLKNDTIGYAAVVVVIATVAIIIGSVAAWKIYLSNQIYLNVSLAAAQGKISILKPISTIEQPIEQPITKPIQIESTKALSSLKELPSLTAPVLTNYDQLDEDDLS